jgi:hypothetical protein
MERFNKYQFVADLEAELLEAVDNGQIESLDDAHEWISQSIDSAVIYAADCFEIIRELHFTDFTGSDFEITNVYQAAFAALFEHVSENLDLNEVQEAIENKVEND